MDINSYLQNPYGKGSSFSGAAKAIADLNTQYTELAASFACKVYKYQSNAIVHVVVPSAKNPNITYDVVLEYKLNDVRPEDITVGDMPCTVFSNCPSFIFTYASVFRKNNLLCNWLDSKYRNEVRKLDPTIKNKYNIIGLERSLYLAMLHLKKSGMYRVSVLTGAINKVSSYSRIASTIRSQDQIMDAVKSKVKPGKGNTVSGAKDEPFSTTKRDLSRADRKDATPTTRTSFLTKSTTTIKSSNTSQKSMKGKTVKKI